MNTLRKMGAKYNVTFCTFAGLSTDTKPVGTVLVDNRSVTLANGSEFIEMDTDEKYLYDAKNQQWHKASETVYGQLYDQDGYAIADSNDNLLFAKG